MVPTIHEDHNAKSQSLVSIIESGRRHITCYWPTKLHEYTLSLLWCLHCQWYDKRVSSMTLLIAAISLLQPRNLTVSHAFARVRRARCFYPVRRCLNSRFSCFQFPFRFRNRCRPCQGVYRISMCSDSLTLTIDMRIINYIFIYLGTWACSCLGVVIGTRHGQRSGQASTIRCPSYRPRTARICFGMICVGEGIYNFTNSWWNWSQILQLDTT